MIVNLLEGCHKASKGLIRVSVEVEDDIIKEIIISGDFFMHPEDKLWDLERSLVGVKVGRTTVLSVIQRFYKENGVSTPGVEPEDFTEAIMKAVGSSVKC